MKIVIFESYGRFFLPESFCEKYGLPTDDDFAENFDRTDERLVALAEEDAKGKDPYSLDYTYLAVEIPDNATDWIIENYDGLEWVTYVVDGKIYRVDYEGVF